MHAYDQDEQLIATCQRNGTRYQIALLDITLDSDPDTPRLIAASSRWLTA